MSEYNIQMNKYNALNAQYDQLYPQPMKHASTHAKDGNDPITPSMIGTYNKTEIDTALQKKAPAGYGLGEKAKSIDSWDDALVNGWYMAPAPSGVGTGNIWGRVDCLSATYLVQTVYADNNKNSARRFRIGNVFSEWEWVNPPMALGEEYRTTERYQGKPVYVQRISFNGALPANGNEQGIINSLPLATTNIIDINVTIKNRTTLEVQRLPSVSTSGAVTAICNPLKYGDYEEYAFRITVFTDMSGWDYQACIVKYTKSTD